MANLLKRRSVWSTNVITPLQRGNDNNGNQNCRNLFRPLLVSMAVIGLCHGNVVWGSSTHGKLTNVGRFINKIYSICVLLLLWILAIKAFSSYSSEDTFGPALLLKIGSHMWQLLCALCTSICYRMCSNEGRVAKCVEDIVYQNEISSDCQVNIKSLAKIVKTCTAFAWLTVLLPMIGNVYSVNEYTLNTVLSPLEFDYNDTNSRLSATMLASFFSLYQIACYNFPGFLVCIISIALYRLFGSIASKVGNRETSRDVFASNKEDEGDDLECIRQQHQRLCRLVSDADEIFSAYNASVLLFMSGITLLLLYQLISNSEMFSDTSNRVLLLMWIAGGLIKIAVISIGGAFLSSKAHEPLKTIHDIDLTDISNEKATQARMFLHKLAGPTIGLTVLKLFTIDMKMISSLVGMFMTYFIILVQFQQSATQTMARANNTCNCSSLISGR
ncbi:hypothetical protein ScPMuIL_006898 [Solemya velum]